MEDRIDQLGRKRMSTECNTHTFPHIHTSSESENEIFQAAISAANSITEGTCTKSCDFPDGEIGKGRWLQTVNNRTRLWRLLRAGTSTKTIKAMWTGVRAQRPAEIKGHEFKKVLSHYLPPT